MTRILITVDSEHRHGLQAKLVEPSGYGKPQMLPLPKPQQLITSKKGRRLQIEGQRLLKRLTQHPQVKDALRDAIRTDSAEVLPLYIEVGTTAAGLPAWETLWDSRANGFLALQPRWPISRVTAQRSGATVVRIFAPPLRIMAFLAAFDVDALDEWEGLYAAANAVHGNFAIQLDVVVGSQKLFDKVSEKAAPHNWVRVMGLPASAAETLLLIENGHPESGEPPHIVHFFSHGGVVNGVGRLELATMRDNESSTAKSGSVVLTVDDLASLQSLSQVWLFALDACSGGRGSIEAESLAQGLVSAGAPAVVGWREPIDAPSANVFCRSFYASLLPMLRDRLGKLRRMESVRIEWATALTRPRGALCGQDPEQHREWSLPLLYVREAPFEVVGGAPSSDETNLADEKALAAIDTLVGLLQSLPPDTDSGVGEKILDRIDQLLEASSDRE